MGEILNRLFFILLVNQSLCLDSVYLPGRDNKVDDAMLRLGKDKLAPVSSLFQSFLLLASYRCYQPAIDLSLQIFNFLVSASDELPDLLTLYRHFSPTRKNAQTLSMACS